MAIDEAQPITGPNRAIDEKKKGSKRTEVCALQFASSQIPPGNTLKGPP